MIDRNYFSEKFVSAKQGLNTIQHHVNAPYIRKEFVTDKEGFYKLQVTATGFYRAFVNGKEITRSILAPYMTNPNQYMFYDSYEIKLPQGKNAVGFILGNGLANSLDYNVWLFEKASFRSIPKVAFAVFDEENIVTEGDESKSFPSPVTFDDLHAGEYYDKNLEIEDFSCPDFDASSWENTLSAEPPKGEKVLSTVPPIIVERELLAKKITPCDGGFVYDFGYTSAGNMRLHLKDAKPGQVINYVHTEVTKNGKPTIETLVCGRMKTNQGFQYTAKGLEDEYYQPYFTYVGCRYVFVTGISEKQATPDLFTFMIMHADVAETGFFKCSDQMANSIEEITKNSDKSNLFYFPTDCPHREKNGWTGDASLSAEHYLANFDASLNLDVWQNLILKSQRKDGALPGIVPTDTWGFLWGNGPLWDAVMINIPYEVYRVKGDKAIIEKSADAIIKYLRYTQKKLTSTGLANFGLGDWVQTFCPTGLTYAPIRVTNTLSLIDSCKKSRKMFLAIGDTEKADFCKKYAEKLTKSFRQNLINHHTMKVKGNCQTSQAYALYCGIFTEEEKPKAAKVLLDIIKRDGYIANAGFIGMRILYHVLADIGQEELAYTLITQSKFPSYGYMVSIGSTSLWETFDKLKVAPNGDIFRQVVYLKPSQAPTLGRAIHFAIGRFMLKVRPKSGIGRAYSMNHHAFGDVSNFFKRIICGICVNDSLTDITHTDIKPHFISTLTFAEASREVKGGILFVRWDRKDGKVILRCDVPSGIHGSIKAPEGYAFADGSCKNPLASGTYTFIKD